MSFKLVTHSSVRRELMIVSAVMMESQKLVKQHLYVLLNRNQLDSLHLRMEFAQNRK